MIFILHVIVPCSTPQSLRHDYFLYEATNSIAIPPPPTVVHHIIILPFLPTFCHAAKKVNWYRLNLRCNWNDFLYDLKKLSVWIRFTKDRGFHLTTGSSCCASAGLLNLAMKLAHARPKTTRSSKELAPSLLAPWTEAHADSPAAQRPGTISSLPSFFVSACNED